MKNILQAILIGSILFLSTNGYAQARGGQGKHNMFGLKVGATQFNIITDNMVVTPEMGFIGGLATRGDFYNNWDIQMGMNISNNKLKVQGRQLLLTPIKEIEYSILNAQIQLLLGYKIIGNNRNMQSNFKLTVEAGPVLMVNSKMKLANDDYENYIIEKANITAEQLTDITPINFNGLIGLSMGLERLRIFGHYQYGFNNMLNRLNEIEGATQKFKGNVSMFQFGALIYF